VTLSGKKYYFNCDGTLNTNTMTEEEFIAMVGKLAREDMKKSGILASVTIAQAILESGYGTTSLGMEANNLFGMKAELSNNAWPSSWKGKTFTKSTKEYLNKKWRTVTAVFRSYSSFAESIADHSSYLANAMNGDKLRYEGVVGNTSYKSTLKLIKKGGYATDPKYVTKLCNIIERFNLTQYDK
jgi:flagellum-specific peptidoglycan hydrolase FlgJ